MTAISELLTDNIGSWTEAVKPKASTGRGGGSSAELYGVKKLRELILDLAVRGMLVPQDPSEESAEELVRDIDAQKAELVQAGKFKQPKASASASTYPDAALPNGWVWSYLAEVAQIAPKNDVLDDTKVGFVPMDLVTTAFDGRHGQEVKPWSSVKKGYTHFADGDVAVAKITPCFENGKAAVFSGLEGGVGAGTTELHVARPFTEEVVRRYLLIYLKSPVFLRVGEAKMTGTAGQKRLPKDFFAFNPLPLPPAAEQHRIVAKVDELMALCDKLEAQQADALEAHKTLVTTVLGALTKATEKESFDTAWTRIAEHFDILFTTEWSVDQLKQTILQLAVVGRLVQQNANEETNLLVYEKNASDSARMVRERKVNRPKQFVDFVGLDDLRRGIPQHWQWVRLGDITKVVRGGSPRPAGDPKFYGGDIPFLKVADVTRKTGKFVEGFKATITEAGLKKTRLITNRTVLLSNSGATLGIPAICDFDTTFNDGIAAFIELSEEVFDEFLYCYLASLSKWYLDVASRGQGQPNLNTDIIKATWFPLPPIDEQRIIVAKVDELLNICDHLKSAIGESQCTQLLLADAITEQAVA